MKHAILFLLAAAVVTRADVVLTPVQDRDVYQGTGLPTSTPYSLGVSSSAAFGGGHSQKSLIQFNVTSTTAGITAAEVGSARLRLYVLPPEVYPRGLDIGGDIQIFFQKTAWTSTNLFWNSFQPGVQVGTLKLVADRDLGDGSSTRVYPLNTWVEVDVTPAVKAWLAGTEANHGLVLSPDEAGSPYLSSVFAASNTGFKPELVIVKAAPSPLQVTAFSFDGATVKLFWSSQAGKTYRVKESVDLENWTDRVTVSANGSSSSAEFGGTLFTEKKAFYVVEELP